MNDRANLLYEELRSSWIPFGPIRQTDPRRALVWADKDGDVHGFATGTKPTLSDYVRLRVRRRYEVDRSEHRERLLLHLPAEGELDHFDVIAAIGFKVGDPVEIVKRNLGDVLTLIRDHLSSTLRPKTRQFRIDKSPDAEVAVNSELASTAFTGKFDPAIKIVSCWATVKPDAAYRGPVGAKAKAEHERVVNRIQNSAKIDTHVRMVNDLRGRQLNPRQLIGYYLQHNPSDGEKALRLLIEYEEAQQARLDTQNRRWHDLFRFMVEKELVTVAHVDDLRNKVMTLIHTPPAPVKTDVVLPVYLVVDESGAIDLGLLNAGIGDLFNGLLAEPEAAAPVRLAVLGLAGTVETRLSPTAITEANQPPTFVRRSGMGYLAAMTFLREQLPGQLGRLWSQGFAAHRPVVFFLTATRPDGPDWWDERDRLVNREDNWYAPHIVVYAIAEGQTPGTWDPHVDRLATQAEFGFVTNDRRSTAVPNAFSALRRSIVSSGRALADNRIRMVVVKPDGFREV